MVKTGLVQKTVKLLAKWLKTFRKNALARLQCTELFFFTKRCLVQTNDKKTNIYKL